MKKMQENSGKEGETLKNRCQKQTRQYQKEWRIRLGKNKQRIKKGIKGREDERKKKLQMVF